MLLPILRTDAVFRFSDRMLLFIFLADKKSPPLRPFRVAPIPFFELFQESPLIFVDSCRIICYNSFEKRTPQLKEQWSK